MLSFLLQIVLLIAAAYSQIFGGVSCCCFSRELSASWTSTGKLNGQEPLATSNTEAPKCQKCEASRTANTSNDRRDKNHDSCSVRDDNQCRCAVVATTVALQTEPCSLNAASHTLATSTVVWNAIPTVKNTVTRRYEKLVRIGGHSWQSIACIWKN
jgi:hypothetical protein